MTQKVFNFLSSFGFMLAGVILLFVSSVSIELKKDQQFLTLPRSAPRVAVGGDIAVTPSLPRARPTVPLSRDKSIFSATTSAVAILAIDDKTDTIFFEKNSEAVRSLASITKLMTALVLLDLPIDWTATTEVLASDLDGSSHHLNAGEKFHLDDLWNVALVGSDNIAIKILVRSSGITPDNFVILMNEKAKRLGMTSARFSDPTGLDGDNVAKAKDVARLLGIALKQERIAQALQNPEYYAEPIGGKKRRVWSTDWLLTGWIASGFDRTQIAGKTGYIMDSNFNFVVRLTDNNNHSIRVVIMGAPSNETRFLEARDLANWVFAHYLWPEDEGYSELVE
ncbi:MAG: serine hydrolase [Candidatus Magasanikbacteria bacterium]|jgi:D-alanyl-D-alanine endopeptidase (penicillin-binding protein 7)